jgi:IMP dehydrogenase
MNRMSLLYQQGRNRLRRHYYYGIEWHFPPAGGTILFNNLGVDMAAGREEFFEDMHGSPNHLYLPYSQIGLRTERISQVDWQDVDITGRVSTNWSLRNPIIGAAMNCISEDAMGIAMAKVGGAAFIHHVNTPEEQKTLAANVYHNLAGIIEDPYCAREDETLEDVLGILDERRKKFRTLPVINSDGECTGLVDETIFQLFSPDTTIKEAMHPFGSFATGEKDATPQAVYKRMQGERLGRVVLLDERRRVAGLCLAKGIVRVIESNPDEFSLDEDGRLIAFASVPTVPDEAVERAQKLQKYVKVISIDTSHGEHKYALETLKALKENVSGVDIVAGNISTEQTAIAVARLEPDGIQVGQGPGEICVSSDRLGFGTPQASAVYEVSKGAWSINPEMPIIADGGIKEPADFVKAIACGATAVKVGNLVAGTDETPVPVERDEKTGAPFRWYWGMGSERAQRAFAAARARYGDYRLFNRIFVEGFEKKVPLKGPVSEVIEEHVMGIKKSMGAQGFPNTSELLEGARFGRGHN